jgi:hypothetical protein
LRMSRKQTEVKRKDADEARQPKKKKKTSKVSRKRTRSEKRWCRSRTLIGNFPCDK